MSRRSAGRTHEVALLAFLLALLSAASAHPAELPWEGTFALTIGDSHEVSWSRSGVATVNASGGGPSLQSLRFAGGLTLNGTSWAATYYSDLTGSHPLVPCCDRMGLLNPALGTGTLTGFAGGGAIGGLLPILGSWFYFQERFPLGSANATSGLGIGGSRFFYTTTFGTGMIPEFGRLSIQFAPWTLGTAAVRNSAWTPLPTMPPPYFTSNATMRGFRHGPASNTSSTALAGGALQLVTPMQVTIVNGVDAFAGTFGHFGVLTLRFVPEPGRLVLLSAGVVVLALLGWRRARRDREPGV